MKPWFSFHMPSYTFPGTPDAQLFDRIAELARAAEDAGFAQVTVMDHLHQIGGVGAVDEPMLEGWSVLNALARETKRVRLGTQVSGVTYRNPAMLAKMATSLDVISGGRAMLGIGAAWNEDEHRGYGFDFPVVSERMDRLDEALTIIKKMFTQERPSFAGTHYRIEDVLNSPRPIQPGGPRVMVGGVGEQRTLRIAAKHADMTHWFALGMDALQRKTDILFGYCAEIGRDPSTIERVIGAPVMVFDDPADAEPFLAHMPVERRQGMLVLPAADAAESLRPYIDAGFTGFTFNDTMYRTPRDVARLGEVLGKLG
ncbi:MAG: LLM class F420-dependent oxidoreductase [Candidatus Limnocylindrales bacterium]